MKRDISPMAMRRTKSGEGSAGKPAARLPIRVQPNASRDQIGAKQEGRWRVAVTAPPVDGRANRACTGLLAKWLGVPRSGVRVVRGEASRFKLIEVRAGLTPAEIEARLEAAVSGKG